MTAARWAAHLRARHEWYWAPLLYCAAVVFLYRDMFFAGDGVRLGFGWDTIESYWADLAYLAGALRDGEAPLWNPFEVGGSPAYARPSRATFYPANWPLVAYGAAAGEVSWWLVQIKMVGHHVAAGAVMHLFLRSRGLSRTAALVGGLAWMASAPMLLHKASAILWPMVWTPVIWLAADRLAARPSWRTGCGLGAAVVLAGTAGSPPGFFYTLLMALPYGALRVGQRLWDARASRGGLVAASRSLAAALGIAAALAVAMLLITVVPTQELTALSQRAQRSVAYALQLPLPVRETLTGMWAPTTGIHDPYMGVLVMMLGLYALFARPLVDRGAPLFFVAVAGFFMVLAFGGATPVLEWLVVHVPGFDLFRASNRYKILATPMIAAAAAYGVAGMQEAARSWSRQRITAVAVAAAVAALVIALVELMPASQAADPRIAPWRSVWMAGIAACLVAAAVWVPRRLAFAPAVLMLPVIAYEPQYFVHSRSPAMEPRPDSRPGDVDDRRWLEGLADVRTRYRVYDEFVMEQRAGSRLGVREFRSYPAGSSLEYRRYGEVIRRVERNPELLAAFNVRYVLHGPHHRIGKRANHIKRPPDRIAPEQFRRLERRLGQRPGRRLASGVYEARYPAPLAAWYGAIVERSGADAVLDEVLASLGEDGVRRHVVVEPGAAAAMGSEVARALAEAAEDPPEPVEAELIDYGRNRVRLRVDAPAAGVMMLNEAHYPGWEVEVDGRPARPFFVNWLVRGVAVGPGVHDIVWRFRPAGYGLLLSLWVMGALIMLAALVAPRRRQPGSVTAW